MANVNSKFFDDIRITKKKEDRKKTNKCQWDSCDEIAVHKAPKGRAQEGSYYNLCLKHVREYNKSYNYFEGMSQSDLSKYQKNAMLGNRPTWKLGVDNKDQLGNFSAEDILKRIKNNRINDYSDKESLVQNNSSSDEIKNRYKLLVKRHHPDLQGGKETTDEKLIEIIKSYRYLKSIGLVN